ncbi:hypothetical protein J4Q44_G00378570 [Coregonus suidteri]|uniref:Uncharacterized protein n=1 Tax=Coregonus suidteri TaxID=861788 RepID=A0AAN8QJS4_9TELE
MAATSLANEGARGGVMLLFIHLPHSNDSIWPRLCPHTDVSIHSTIGKFRGVLILSFLLVRGSIAIKCSKQVGA